jgi:hypothetical protein
MKQVRVVGAIALIAIGSVACGAEPAPDSSPGRGAVPAVEPVSLAAVEESPREDVPSALDRATQGLLAVPDPALPAPLVDPTRIRPGGPPPDGIPPVDEPRFVPAAQVDWLADDEPVLALEVGDDARAYPVQILVWHEIVNDTVGGVPVSVTYCPLCTSALAFDRRVGDRLVTFGTSGMLYQSDLVMYDRQTESLWSQLAAEAIAGVLAGTELTRLPVQTLPWARWREAHPEGWVLSRDTGAPRSYGLNPYPGYDEPGERPFLYDGELDARLEPKARVVGLGQDVDPVAIPLEPLAAARVVTVEVAEEPVVVLATEGLRSALDEGDVDEGREIAATGAFRPEADGRAVTLAPSGPQAFTDAETGSTWTLDGRAVAGPLAGERLQPAEYVDTFWFAWSAFQPQTRIVTP